MFALVLKCVCFFCIRQLYPPSVFASSPLGRGALLALWCGAATDWKRLNVNSEPCVPTPRLNLPFYSAAGVSIFLSSLFISCPYPFFSSSSLNPSLSSLAALSTTG